jgi:hypothetical protein
VTYCLLTLVTPQARLLPSAGTNTSRQMRTVKGKTLDSTALQTLNAPACHARSTLRTALVTTLGKGYAKPSAAHLLEDCTQRRWQVRQVRCHASNDTNSSSALQLEHSLHSSDHVSASSIEASQHRLHLKCADSVPDWACARRNMLAAFSSALATMLWQQVASAQHVCNARTTVLRHCDTPLLTIDTDVPVLDHIQ